MRFFRQFWKSQRRPKSAFGGEIKSKEEVANLNRKILTHEQREELQAERELEEAQKHLWKE